MTRAELRRRALETLNDPDGVGFTATRAHDALQDALECWAEESGALHRTAHVALRPGTTYYWTSSVGPDVMAPYRVWHHAGNRRLTAVGWAELEALSLTWPTAGGTPEAWFPVSWDCFGIFPHATEGGTVLRIDYLAWPRALLDDADRPEFPEGDHPGLVDYIVYDGLAHRSDVGRMLETWSRFQARLAGGRGMAVRREQARTYQPAVPMDGAAPSGFTRGIWTAGAP